MSTAASRASMAVAPSTAPGWFADAVVAGGGALVPAGEARGLVWGDTEGVEQLEGTLRGAPGVRWVQLPFAGIESVVHLVDDRRIWTCAKGVYAPPVAELAMALALAGMRHVGAYATARTWTSPAGRNLLGARVTILGGGGIAAELARLLAPWGCHVSVVRRAPGPVPGADVVIPADRYREALDGADLVVLALALTPATAGLIGAAELRLMGEDAWLVNVARGRHVVTADLVRALEQGWIAGAALDVTDPEPLPTGHPLWALPNCIVTPHVGNTPEMTGPLLGGRVAENVRRFGAGLPLLGRVDPVAGY